MTRIVDVDMSQALDLAQRLADLRIKGMPFAVRQTLNDSAFAVREHWPKRMAHAFTLRNRYTQGSIRIEKATGTNYESMQAIVGSNLDYLALQESGGIVRGKGGRSKPIPTSSASGQAMRGKRTKRVQAKNYQSAIHLPAKVGGNRQRRNAVALKLAPRHGGVAFLNLGGGRKGLFRVSTTGKGRLRVRMLYDLSRKQVVDKPRPTLEPTADMVRSTLGPGIIARNVQQQLDLKLVRKR